METFKLRKPITAHGEETTELTLRAPTTPDIRTIGMPFLIHASGGEAIEIRTEIVARYISKLAGIPMSAVDAIEPADFGELSGVVIGFFGASPGAT